MACFRRTEVVGGVIAAIPGGFVVDEDGDVGGFGGGWRSCWRGLLRRHDGERLFHHDGDFVLGADFDGAAVAAPVGVAEDGLRVGAGEEFGELGVVELGAEIKFCGLAVEDFAVGFGDAEEFDVVAVFDAGEEAVGMAVGQAGHYDFERGGGGGLRAGGDCE